MQKSLKGCRRFIYTIDDSGFGISFGPDALLIAQPARKGMNSTTQMGAVISKEMRTVEYVGGISAFIQLNFLV
jgi:hypothetical protein